MRDFDHILNWKLLSGSHDFPGPDGGTCINEAAVVAAGFKYRSVVSIDALPTCFCPVLSSYALELNDTMGYEARQSLLPFVMRFAGSRDSKAIEKIRSDFIIAQTIGRVLPTMLDDIGLSEHADLCRRRQSLGSARMSAANAAKAAHGGCSTVPIYSPLFEKALATGSACRTTSRAQTVRDGLMGTKGGLRLDLMGIWPEALTILDEAMMIGRHAEIDVFEARDRLTVAREKTSKPLVAA